MRHILSSLDANYNDYMVVHEPIAYCHIFISVRDL